jgi:hypothetical protein
MATDKPPMYEGQSAIAPYPSQPGYPQQPAAAYPPQYNAPGG